MISCGYAGKILRVNLSDGTFSDENLDNDFLRKYIGGTGFGARYLYQENPDNAEWSDPENRIIMANGPLSGTTVCGSGTMCVVSKGPMTNLAGCSQANGYWGAFLKSCGYDGIIIHGCADRWSYLIINGEKAELRDASHLLGKDTQETQELIREELGIRAGVSIHCIGPAAENRVRFSVTVGDISHTVSKNGLGAVLASKHLKAIVICRGKFKAQIRDAELLKKISKELHEKALTFREGSRHKWGTNGGFSRHLAIGCLPVKNYTTNLFPAHEKMNGQYVRTHFEKIGRNSCFNCGINHNLVMRITEGPYRGIVAEEPEYEAFAALGPQIGQTDAGGVFVLTDLVDRLGMDVNETGWVIGWVMECYDNGILTRKDTDGIEMNWGNVESVRKMLYKISNREGIGDLLAEGVKRASEEIGGAAADMAVCTRKGSTPRGHDHRGRWPELLDTCFTNTSTLEATFGGVRPEELDMPPVHDRFSPWEVCTINATINGWNIFEDCLGVCRFNMTAYKLVVEAFNAATGFDLSLPEIIKTGKRIVNTLRVFNIRNGLTRDIEIPGTRYGSTPTDGPVEGIGIMKHWNLIRETYYRLMGWDPDTGKPLAKTLRDLGLKDLIQDIED
ncbi:MAG: aldehyde ferredoxin oxidoreductase family protein [Thermodesulfobacteriota bacterium]